MVTTAGTVLAAHVVVSLNIVSPFRISEVPKRPKVSDLNSVVEPPNPSKSFNDFQVPRTLDGGSGGVGAKGPRVLI
jgi:hypothetical protein